jgi:hypothetical protein
MSALEWMLLLSIWQELLKQGWLDCTYKDYRENFSAIKIKEIDADGKESYVIKVLTWIIKGIRKRPTLEV